MMWLCISGKGILYILIFLAGIAWETSILVSEYCNICELCYFFVPHKGTWTCHVEQQPSQCKLYTYEHKTELGHVACHIE